MYLEGLEYTADEWKSHHSKIGLNSSGALRRHPQYYIRSGYCRRAQATQNSSYVIAKRVSTAPSPHGCHMCVDRVNVETNGKSGRT